MTKELRTTNEKSDSSFLCHFKENSQLQHCEFASAETVPQQRRPAGVYLNYDVL